MANLDFYLKENGRIEYTKDISLTQYSTSYSIRLFTKVTFDIVNMNVTLPNQIKTYKKNLQLQTSLIDGYYVYSYKLGQDITGVELGAEKAIIKVGFFMYPDSSDQLNVITSGTCYLPILASPDDMPSDGSVTVSELSNLQGTLNDIQEQILDLNIGKIETAKNYDENDGNIKDKFNSVEVDIDSLEYRTALIEKQIGSLGSGDGEIDSSFVEQFLNIQNQINALDKTDDQLTSLITNNALAIDKINNALPTLQAGVKYEIVSGLPVKGVEGTIYLVKNTEIAGNVYTEYMYINGSWEIIGNTTAKVDLSQYYTKTEIDSSYALKKDIPTKVSDIANDAGYITNSALSGYAKIADIPTRTSALINDSGYATNTGVDGKLSNYTSLSTFESAKTALQTSISNNTVNINTIRVDISDLDRELSEVSSVANEAWNLVNSTTKAVVFDNRAEMVSFIQRKPDKSLAVGSTFLIKDKDVSDYWIAAVYTTPTKYINKAADVFENVYYGVEEIETGIEIDNYATNEYVNATFATKGELNTGLGEKEDHENKITEIKASSTDVEYPSARATYRLVSSTETRIMQNVDNTYATKAKLTQEVKTLNDTITEIKNELDSKDAEIDSRLDDHDTLLSNHENRITKNEADIANRYTKAETDREIDNHILAIIDGASEAFDTFKEVEKYIQDHKDEVSTTILPSIQLNKENIAKEVIAREDADRVEQEARIAADETLQSNIDTLSSNLTNALEEHAQYAEARYLDHSEYISRSEGVIDYTDTENKTKVLRFSTDSTDTDFVVSNKDLSELQIMLTMIAPNEYN